jgi:integrase
MRRRTVAECAEECIRAMEPGWKGHRQAADWRSRFSNYVFPAIGDLSVGSVDTPQVRAVLDPIWNAMPVMAGRVRERLAKVLDFAVVNGYREAGPNPARWRGHLDHVYAKRSTVQPARRHPALPYAEAPSFITALRDRDGIDARAMEFLILTAVRASEVLLMQWEEVDVAARVWTVPAAHRKATKDRAADHRVPLSDAAIAIIEGMPRIGDYVFPGKAGRMSQTAFFALLRKLQRPDLTTHGMRSAFRTWVGERTAFPREVAEQALGHSIAGEAERAYARGDLFEKRRQIMDAWAKFCAAPLPVADEKVVTLRR